MTHRVIQWSTGNVGTLALKAIIEHPGLELAGLWVHSADKVGRDAADLAGLPDSAPRTGVLATNDVDALLALGADVVCYTATGDLRPDEAVADLCRFLRAGMNVVSTSVVALVYPPMAEQRWVDAIEAACAEGNTSCFTNGIDPGFANELIPLMFTGFASRIDKVHVQEILNYDTYNQPTVLFDTMGFGQPMDAMPLILIPGVLTMGWGPVVQMIADGLGVTLDRIDEWHEKWEAPVRYETAVGPIEAGTMAGLRFELRGVIDDVDKIVIEHVTRMHNDAAPEWPQHTNPQGGYRIEVIGNPTYRCDLEIVGDDGDHNTGGLVGTAMRILNAIPAVCDAPPGLVSTLDLPLVTGRHLMT